MKTEHKTFFSDSGRMKDLPENSVDLLVTSPPYPMIEMWDNIFAGQHARIKKQLGGSNGPGTFEAMHRILDNTWKEAYRVLKPGSFACINIGDATRTLGGNFALYPNHARIATAMLSLGFTSLPCIIWRKQTNAPNKFMGSGMLPAGAYVTLEHEYILIFRKGGKREFTSQEEKQLRRESALFWEERNQWFSDVWLDIKGTRQDTNDKETRKRSAAFPFEIPWRLINMYSVKGDLVLDPFLGLGTTTLAAMAAGRNSVGFEIDPGLGDAIRRGRNKIIETAGTLIRKRLADHLEFVSGRLQTGKTFKHMNTRYRFPVVTNQEKELFFNEPITIRETEKHVSVVDYSEEPTPEFCTDWEPVIEAGQIAGTVEKQKRKPKTGIPKQQTLF